ncbi:oligogalacturonate lyase family protein [Caulobacter sp.]|uniref:oligogalacturonate lyase family protein n=1 Tax=Caulobacter sp. TaxID=78 RepID=UPI003BAD2CA2
MKAPLLSLLALAALAFAPAARAQDVMTHPAAGAAEPPLEWIDRDTGHRVVRLSREAGSSSLYFNFNAYTPKGDRLVFSSPGGITVMDLKTRALRKIVEGKVRLLFVGRKTGAVYYEKAVGDAPNGPKVVMAIDPYTGTTRQVATLDRGGLQTLNADETLLAGVAVRTDVPVPADAAQALPRNPDDVKGPDGRDLSYAEGREVQLNARLDSRIPMEIFTINTVTGERRIVHQATDWLNHLQFSPTDPNLLMFCHEGPWHKVDRLWLVRTDRADAPVKIHTRTMNMEIAGHEWFSADGKTVWYDLQTPRGEDFWVAGYEIATGKRTWLHLDRNAWSVHFNSSPDGKLFAGDGGDSEMVAHAPDGKWLYLMRPRTIPDVAGIHAPGSETLIQPGVIDTEKLVNMKAHDYRLEPNVNFTPDQKWIVFRSNMHGASHVYAVELAKAAQ